MDKVECVDKVNFKAGLMERLLSHSFEKVLNAEGTWASGLLVRVENPVLYIVCVYEEDSLAFGRQQLLEFSQQMLEHLAEVHCSHLISLGINLGGEGFWEEEPQIVDERLHRVEWLVHRETGTVTTKKDAPDQLLHIDKWLKAVARGEEGEKPVAVANPQGKPWVCMSIFAICLILLGLTELLPTGGQIIYDFGLSRSAVLAGAYYRFLTSMFLHSGVAHLLSNCVFLYYFGVGAERFLGWKKFLVLYLASGLFGGLASVLCHDVLAVGASGAIYGLLGAMLLLTKKHGSAYTGMNYATMVLLACMSVGFGFLDMGVDNFAHLGGFFGGIFIFFLFLKKQPRVDQ